MATKRKVRRPYERVTLNVRNQSARSGSIKLIVVHSTESHERPGNADLEAIGSWFNNSKSQASSHVCVDKEGRSAKYVNDAKKAWHCAGYNSVSLGIEQIGFSADSESKWTDKQLDKVARYIAYWSDRYDIPIRKGKVRKGVVKRSGIVRHSDLGVEGGNHGDPGRGYPLRKVLRLARRYRKEGW